MGGAMAHFRVDAVMDKTSGRWFAEVFYPADALEPLVRSRPWFATEAKAHEFAKKSLTKIFGDLVDFQPN